MPAYVLEPNAVPKASADQICAELLASPFVGDSPLAGTFEASRGFSIIFKRAGLSELFRRMAPAVPFIDLALTDAVSKCLTGWPARWLRPPPSPNAFYLNLLMVPVGAAVGPHVDATLRSHCGDDTVIPRLVSVLYLRVPVGMRGGELILTRGEVPVTRIQPEVGTLLHFDGSLRHAVAPVQHADPTALRISLICEQYDLPPGPLANLPDITVHSKAGFGAYLEDQKSRPPKRFVLD